MGFIYIFRIRIDLALFVSTVIRSFGWQAAQQVARGAVGMLIASVVARSFGERGLGILDGSFALINLLAACAGLGMQKIITRDLCGADETRNSRVRGSGLALSIVACAVAVILANLLVWNSHQEERLVVLAASALLLLQPFGFMISSIFESRGRMDIIGKVLFVGLLVSTVARLACVYFGTPLPMLALAYSIDIAASCLLAWIISAYYFRSWIKGWKVDFSTAKYLLKQSLPLLLSSIAAFIYISVDTLMLKWMVGPEETGAYGAAIRISQIPVFIPGILASAYTARLMASHLATGTFGKQDLTTLSRLLLALGAAILLGGWLLGPLAIKIIYGEAFIRSGLILQIHVLGIFFMIVGSLRNHLLVLEGREKLILLCDGSGAAANVLLNFFLIPHYGAVGASLATVASYFLSFFLINAIYPGLRPYNRLLFLAFQRNPDSQNP